MTNRWTGAPRCVLLLLMAAAPACQTPAEPADKVAVCAKTSDATCLAALMKTGDTRQQDRALEALVSMKSKAAVPALLAALLNTLQTGGDGKAVAEKLRAIDPDAMTRARDEMIAKAAAAREKGSTLAAGQYLENAQALARLAGGPDLAGEEKKIDGVKKAKRHADLVEKLIDAMENGQLSRSFEIAKTFSEETGDEQVRRVLPDLQKLSDLEDKFYATAQAQEKAKAAFDAAKASEGKAERDKASPAYQAAKNQMVLIRRALEKERRQLPLLTEKVREATIQYLK